METHIDKKFYVPDITEFHVGFEYQQKNKLGEWKDLTITNGGSEYPDYDQLDYVTWWLEDIRVKYLDKEDIESLGWEDPVGAGIFF